MNIRPLGPRVLVKPVKEEEITKAGIVLPDTIDKDKKAEGEIVAIGNGEKLEQLNLKVGQTIIFGKYAGEEVKIDGQDYKIVSYDDMLAVLE